METKLCKLPECNNPTRNWRWNFCSRSHAAKFSVSRKHKLVEPIEPKKLVLVEKIKTPIKKEKLVLGKNKKTSIKKEKATAISQKTQENTSVDFMGPILPWKLLKALKKGKQIDISGDRRKFYDRNDLLKIVTPKWADKEKIKKIYEESKRLSADTGISYQVDHIIPLKHPLVCGLHVENNLRIITKEENYKKNNKFIVE
jgi:hypothetical protein